MLLNEGRNKDRNDVTEIALSSLNYDYSTVPSQGNMNTTRPSLVSGLRNPILRGLNRERINMTICYNIGNAYSN